MSATSSVCHHPIVKPKALQPGDTVAILSPAAGTADPPDAFEQGMALLAAEGFKTKLMPNAKKVHVYLAGTDAERLADLHAAFADPQVNGILCSRGGYGALRLVGKIDYDLIAQNPKVFIGFSDITVLHTAFYQKTGLVGFYGPMMTSNLIQNEPYSQAELMRLVKGEASMPFAVPNRDSYQCFHPGVAEGRLVGGNLSLIRSLCGTPYQLDTRGAILFIEDWRERYYALDRQFQHLKLAGLLDDIAGLLLCDFSELTPDNKLTVAEQLKDLTTDLLEGRQIPVGYGFSVGHGEETATLPIGTLARFNGETGELTLLESPVS
jgi:muramoyltetrapeptide carboxypeptidase